MIIQVDWFKNSGKWWYGGPLEIRDDTYLWSDDFKQQIVDNQKIIGDNWQESDYYYVVTRNHPGDEMSPNFRGFHFYLFKPGAFKGIKKIIWKILKKLNVIFLATNTMK